MAFINWSDTYSVQIEEIDDQHKKLIALINELFDSMQKGQSRQVIGRILNDLIDYTAVHFKTEETYFDRFNYEDSAEHKEKHKRLVDNVIKVKSDFESGKISVSSDLLKFLKRWLFEHILETDKKYITCFHQNGVK